MTGRRRYLRRWIWAALGVLPVAFLSGCSFLGAGPQSADQPHADNARLIWNLFVPIFWLSVVVFVIVEGILLVAVVRFRRRPGQPMPQPIHGNTKLEIAWTLLPALILAVIAVPTISGIATLAQNPGPSAMTIRVIGQQWWWAFEYPDTGVVVADELHVPEGQTVRLELTSRDVIHSFWVPQLAGKQDAVPGRTNFINFKADTPGEYDGQCAEFCGAQHAHMLFRVFVDTPAQFQAWVQSQEKFPATPASGTAAAAGEQLFMSGACIGCHTINGTKAQGTIGPNLTHFGSRTLIAGGVLSNTPQNLEAWIHDAPGIKPGQASAQGASPGHNQIVMPAFPNYTPDQLSQLAAYLESLK
ncbi:MAG TPA: cytochrome c oxidase subunit II [Thermomicrobiaceae bacterium]|nr:cytochrome c oxidase subunit II [Thermomicrobiaceae bacterium]